MTDPAAYRPAPGSVPDAPGVYRYRDPHGRVVYVGKAKSLRSRLGQYFQDPAGLHPRTLAMLETASSVEWTVVANEVEALQLEYAWIKEFDPRFNVKYRDDKSYPFLAVTLSDTYPRAQVLRGAKRKGVRYFGPYSHAWAIRDTLDQLLRVFPVRTCSAGVFRRSEQIGRPCLLGYIGKCSAPCVGRVTPDEHRALVNDLCAFLAGDHQRFVRDLGRQMAAASQAQEYERAARLRDDLRALERALERNTVVLPDDTDADVVALAEDPLEAALQVFHVRGGRIRGQRGWVVERIDDAGPAELMGRFLEHLYSADRSDDVPREILVSDQAPDVPVLERWLSGVRGSQVEVRVPRRGDKRALLETVRQNAAHSLALHKLRRSGDLTARSQALQDLQDQLGLDEAPLRIECFDVSHLGGTDTVASMVVFEDGVPRKSEYRRFSLPDLDRPDDVAAMHQVLTRRFERGRAERSEDEEVGQRRRFAYPPNLLVVDGGAPQVGAAAAALAEVGVPDVTVVGLAKRLEEVWLPGDDAPVILPRGSQSLYLLQRIRDEAHRFAIAYQRSKRRRGARASELDRVPGLGATRKA
ncbi:MAG: excinuclease ABC subunit UvrC, partial [Actinomycetota bacterium]|nr:excinuclease ABC subunit UvrC [Actinomycetota bacterium]